MCQVQTPILSESDGNGVCHASGARHAVPRGKKNPLYSSVSRRLIELRAGTDLSQRALGEISGLNAHAISSIERGSVVSKISTIEQLAVGLGVSPAWLAFGADGHLQWKERHPRYGIGPDESPRPAPASRACEHLYRGAGARLRQAREAKGLSMRELGRQAGCTVAAISLLEAGTSTVLLSTCEDLAKVLEVAPGWLAYGIGQGPAVN